MAELAGRVLHRREQGPGEAPAAAGGAHPHPLELGDAGVAVDRAERAQARAADRGAVEAGDEEAAPLLGPELPGVGDHRPVIVAVAHQQVGVELGDQRDRVGGVVVRRGDRQLAGQAGRHGCRSRPAIHASTSSAAVGSAADSTRQPSGVTSTSSSIRTPMPRSSSGASASSGCT